MKWIPLLSALMWLSARADNQRSFVAITSGPLCLVKRPVGRS